MYALIMASTTWNVMRLHLHLHVQGCAAHSLSFNRRLEKGGMLRTTMHLKLYFGGCHPICQSLCSLISDLQQVSLWYIAFYKCAAH